MSAANKNEKTKGGFVNGTSPAEIQSFETDAEADAHGGSRGFEIFVVWTATSGRRS